MAFYTDCRLYLLAPAALDDPDAFAAPLAEALGAGDVAAFLLDLPEADEATLSAAARVLMPVCHAHGVAFMLGRRPALAATLGCDGVHIGAQDGTVQAARKALGPDRQLGVSCGGSRDRAMDAAEAGADYVAFGSLPEPVPLPDTPAADPETLRVWTTFSVIPAVATGGITTTNCLPLIQAGANFLAVSDGVWGYKNGPAAAVREFNRVIATATPSVA